MPMISSLRQGLPFHLVLPLMKIGCASPRQKHVEEAITPLPSTIHLVMVCVVVDGEKEVT